MTSKSRVRDVKCRTWREQLAPNEVAARVPAGPSECGLDRQLRRFGVLHASPAAKGRLESALHRFEEQLRDIEDLRGVRCSPVSLFLGQPVGQHHPTERTSGRYRIVAA